MDREEEMETSQSQPVTATADAATEGAEPSAAFTPGPWEAKQRRSASPYDERWSILPAHSEGWPSVVAWVLQGRDEANARLIAAAPDLYEAAKAAKTLLVPDLDEPGRTVFWKLVDALAKAEGRS